MRPAGNPTSTLPVRTLPTLLTIRAFARSCLMACQKNPSYDVVIALTPAYSADSSLTPFNIFLLRPDLHRSKFVLSVFTCALLTSPLAMPPVWA